MAGSYNHCVLHDLKGADEEHNGKFIGVRLLDHLGDAYEALEEMYQMIWILADGDQRNIDDAQLRYKDKQFMSPGTYDHEKSLPGEDDE